MATFTPQSKNSGSFVAQAKSNFANTYLLLQDGFKLLLQNGGRIQLMRGTTYSAQSKNMATFTNQAKS